MLRRQFLRVVPVPERGLKWRLRGGMGIAVGGFGYTNRVSFLEEVFTRPLLTRYSLT